jgi:Tat protein translocase TatB subunit
MIGPAEILVILVVALIVIGPEKMPEVARTLAKVIRELRSIMDDVQEQFNEFTREDLLGTNEINSYYKETIDSVKKSIEPPPDMKNVGKEIEDSLKQAENPEAEPKPEVPPVQPSP